MKKYKVYWNFGNVFNKSQAEVVKLQQALKGFTVIIAGSAYMMDNNKYLLIIGAVGFITDFLLSGLYFEKQSLYKGKL